VKLRRHRHVTAERFLVITTTRESNQFQRLVFLRRGVAALRQQTPAAFVNADVGLKGYESHASEPHGFTYARTLLQIIWAVNSKDCSSPRNIIGRSEFARARSILCHCAQSTLLLRLLGASKVFDCHGFFGVAAGAGARRGALECQCTMRHPSLRFSRIAVPSPPPSTCRVLPLSLIDPSPTLASDGYGAELRLQFLVEPQLNFLR